MTDNEIIKALECCSSDAANCDDCPANKYCTNDDFCLTGAILDLVNRQKAEIERLNIAFEKCTINSKILEKQTRCINGRN